MKCKDCNFFSEEKIHGHGEYWGECILIKIFTKTNNINYNDYDIWSNICYNDTKCKLTNIIKLKKGE